MIEFGYTLQNGGWATLAVRFGDSAHEFPMSYMSNALDDLVSATASILAGASVARFAVIDEPGEYCWTLAREGDLLNVRIVHVGRMYQTSAYAYWQSAELSPPEKNGELVATLQCELREFVRAVSRLMRDVESRYTAADFARTRNPPISQASAARFVEP